MKTNESVRYRGSILWSILISAACAILAEAALVGMSNTSMLDSFLLLFGLEDRSVLTEHRYMVLFLLLVFGIGVFAFAFTLLRNQEVKYLREITNTIQEIADGNFSRIVPVVGDDEMAALALQINSMAEEIRTLIDREKDSEQTKNDLITNVAHDLRTPLTSILGYLDILQRQPEIPENRRMDYISIAYKKAEHLQALIDQLFNFTKLGYGMKTAKMEKLDVVRLLGQLIEEFYPQFEDAEIECDFLPDVRSAEMTGDGTMLARLFENLIGNAIKYGKEGKRIRVETVTSEKSISVSVINFGKVIEQKDLDHIFDKFYRAEVSRSQTTGGTGLGLAIAKTIAETHGGRIEVESSIRGTVFRVELPLVSEESGDTAEKPQKADEF